MGRVGRGFVMVGSLAASLVSGVGASWPALLDPAEGGGFLRLDGRSALRVDLPGTPETLTLEAWVRGWPPKGRQGLLCNAEDSGFALFWSDVADGGTLPAGFVHAAGEYASVGADRPWDFARWTHVALSYDGSRVRFFVDGRLTGEAEASGAVTPNTLPLVIGADVDAQGRAVSFWKGDLDEVRLSRVVRYTGDFRPTRRLARDADTVVLLGFDEPLAADVTDTRGGPPIGVIGTPRVVLAEE
jgi:hypothetical protein